MSHNTHHAAPSLDLTDKTPSPILPPASEKRTYVRQMFAEIAPRYDLMNRLMTLGRDQVWRRTVVRLCNLPAGGRLLDVATGTGDIAYEALRSDASVQAVGVDLTAGDDADRTGQASGAELPLRRGGRAGAAVRRRRLRRRVFRLHDAQRGGYSGGFRRTSAAR